MLVSDCVLFGITVFIRAFGFVNGMCHAGFVSFAIGRIKCFHCNQECGALLASAKYGYSIGVC